MIAAQAPRSLQSARLITMGAESIAHHALTALPSLLQPGDLLVLNDAATLPASLIGTTSNGEPLELRLCGNAGDDWIAIVLGEGSWRERTEDRAPPPKLRAGDELMFVAYDGSELATLGARVIRAEPRLVHVRFDRSGDALYRALYRFGRPVQYAYVSEALPLWSVQSAFASRPWAFEPPSAGLSLSAGLLLMLRACGIELARITHAAGLSSTGDAALDARLPFDERYDVPARTVAQIARKRGRVVAVGTTVTRALESAALGGHLRAGVGVTSLRIGSRTRLRVVDAILTGMHAPGSSHFALLEAFAPREDLLDVFHEAETSGYLEHEFGDLLLLERYRRAAKAPMIAPMATTAT